MSFEIVTYANKSEGMFEKLLNNEFGVSIKVLGWNKKWEGYTDKVVGVLEFIETKNDEDIIVFLDGFDTKINKNPEHLISVFKKYDTKVLLSKEPNPMSKYIAKTVFGDCKGNNIANAGLYMGYVKELKIYLNDTLKSKCKDDQRNFNISCKKYDFIKIDEEEKIFQNISPNTFNKNSDAIFVSYPGSLSFNRTIRAFIEYSQFLYIHVLCLLLIGIILFPHYKKPLFYVGLCLLTLYILFADKSCI